MTRRLGLGTEWGCMGRKKNSSTVCENPKTCLGYGCAAARGDATVRYCRVLQSVCPGEFVLQRPVLRVHSVCLQT